MKKTGFFFGFLFTAFCVSLFAQTSLEVGSESLLAFDSAGTIDPGTGELLQKGQKNLEDLSDHKAEVFDVGGNVRIMKTGTSEWYPVTRALLIEEGDQILTGELSYVEISYDKHFLNIVRIDEKTKAEFRTIEPTDLRLEDGTIFCALDGLKAGTEYKVSTPTAVAVVRGTHFEVFYNAVTAEFFAATLPVAEDAHESLIEVRAVQQDGSLGANLELREGFQIRTAGTEVIVPEKMAPLDPAVIERCQGHFQAMSANIENFQALREQGQKEFMMDPQAFEHQKPVESPQEGPGSGGDHGFYAPGPYDAMMMDKGLDAFVDQALMNEEALFNFPGTSPELLPSLQPGEAQDVYRSMVDPSKPMMMDPNLYPQMDPTHQQPMDPSLYPSMDPTLQMSFEPLSSMPSPEDITRQVSEGQKEMRMQQDPQYLQYQQDYCQTHSC